MGRRGNGEERQWGGEAMGRRGDGEERGLGGEVMGRSGNGGRGDRGQKLWRALLYISYYLINQNLFRFWKDNLNQN